MKKTIKFEIQVTAKLLWRFSMYHTNRGATGLFNLIFTVAALALLVTRWGVSSGMYRFTMLFCAMIFTVLQPLMLYRKATAQARQPALKEPMALEFSEEGLLVRQMEQEAQFAWDQIGRIDKTRKMIIVYMDRIHAYLIPEELYADNLEEFTALLHEYLPKERLKRI